MSICPLGISISSAPVSEWQPADGSGEAVEGLELTAKAAVSSPCYFGGDGLLLARWVMPGGD